MSKYRVRQEVCEKLIIDKIKTERSEPLRYDAGDGLIFKGTVRDTPPVYVLYICPVFARDKLCLIPAPYFRSVFPLRASALFFGLLLRLRLRASASGLGLRA